MTTCVEQGATLWTVSSASRRDRERKLALRGLVVFCGFLVCVFASMLVMGYDSLSGSLWSLYSSSSPVDVKSRYEKLINGRNHRSVLVVYSGPLKVPSEKDPSSLLAWRNLEYFIEHGITCMEDVYVVVGFEAYPFVQSRLTAIQRVCREQGAARVRLLERDGHCYDMESVRTVLDDIQKTASEAAVNEAANGAAQALKKSRTTVSSPNAIDEYEYFVVFSDAVTGPHPPEEPSSWPQQPKSWTHLLTDPMENANNKIKMVGLTLTCQGGGGSDNSDRTDPHHHSLPRIDSFLYALDREGLKMVLAAGCIYDCSKDEGGTDPATVMTRYETGLSRTILKAGYRISALAHNVTVTSANTSQCMNNDVWHRHELYRQFGRIPTLPELHFFRTDRFVTPEIAKAIGYTESQTVFEAEQQHWDAENAAVALGGSSKELMDSTPEQGKSNVHVIALMRTCDGLGSIRDYLRAVRVVDVTWINMCGKKVSKRDAPPNTNVLNIANVTVDYVYSSLIRELVTNSPEQKSRGDDILFLIDGDAVAPSVSVGVHDAKNVIYTASTRGFACRRKPYCSPHCRNAYQPTVLHLPSLWSSFAISEQNLGQWFQSLGADLPSTLVPVCYGRSFAFRRRELARQPLEVWQNLEKIMAAPTSHDEIYAERAWAALLAKPIEDDVKTDLMKRTERVLGGDVGGQLKKYVAQQWDQEMNGMLLWKLEHF